MHISTLIISIYGAFIATIVALWQFWCAFRDRRWISINYNFRSIKDPGNEVLLINNSPRPLTLYRIELFWGRRYLVWTHCFQRVGCDDWSNEDSDLGITIDPYKIKALHFANDRHFDWCYDERPSARLYLRTKVVGRAMPMTLLVYRQNLSLCRKLLEGLGFDVRP